MSRIWHHATDCKCKTRKLANLIGQEWLISLTVVIDLKDGHLRRVSGSTAHRVTAVHMQT